MPLHNYCGVSNIYLHKKTPVYVLPLIHTNPEYKEYPSYTPFCLPIRGIYTANFPQLISKIEETENTKNIENYFGCSIKDFCAYITNKEDCANFYKKFKFNLSELEQIEPMIINAEIYDKFATFYNKKFYNLKGKHDFYNSILIYLGFEQIEKHKWRFDGVDFIQHPNKYSLNCIIDGEEITINNLFAIYEHCGYTLEGLKLPLNTQKMDYLHSKPHYGIYDITGEECQYEAFKRLLWDNNMYNANALLREKEKLLTFKLNLHSMSKKFIPNLFHESPQNGEDVEHKMLLDIISQVLEQQIVSKS